MPEMNKKIIIGLIYTCSLFSCGVDDEKISPAERLMIDTMSTNEIVRQRIEWDKQCNVKLDSMVKFAIDSLTAVTLQKIDKKIKEYQ